MRTVRCSSRLLGVSVQEGVCPGGVWQTSPPCGQNHRHLWKHYLAPTTLRTVKTSKRSKVPLTKVVTLTVRVNRPQAESRDWTCVTTVTAAHANCNNGAHYHSSIFKQNLIPEKTKKKEKWQVIYSPDVWKPAQIFCNPALVVVAAPCENRSIISSLVTKGNLVFLLDIDYWKALILRRFPQWHRQFPSRQIISLLFCRFLYDCAYSSVHVFDLGIRYFCRK